jgi:hypothetical protein
MKTTMELCKEAGFPLMSFEGVTYVSPELERLVALVRADEREQAAAQPAPVQEPVSMRMPKVGDKVVCIEDESLGTVVYLTAGGSPEIKFDDGSHGTYMLREFAELFGYTTPPAAEWQKIECPICGDMAVATDIPPAQRTWVALTDEEIRHINRSTMSLPIEEVLNSFARAIEAKLKEKNT